MTIVEFLNARLDEDEAVAVAAIEVMRRNEGKPQLKIRGLLAQTPAAYEKHSYRWSPAAVRAGIASKRAMVAEYERVERSKDEYPNAVNFASWLAMLFCVKQIASLHTPHPDYMPAWDA